MSAILSLMFFLSTLLLGLLPFLAIAALIGGGVWLFFRYRYRNAEARYEPGKTVARTTSNARGSDTPIGRFASSSPLVPVPNDRMPHVRAQCSVYFVGGSVPRSEIGPPPSGPSRVPLEVLGTANMRLALGNRKAPVVPVRVQEPPTSQ